jgi:hypothetical protein
MDTLRSNPVIRTALTALLTAITLAGSIWVILYIVIDVIEIPAMSVVTAKEVILLLSLIIIPIAGGGMWGAGLAALARLPARPLIYKGMWTWGLSVVFAGILIDLTQIPAFAIASRVDLPHIMHYLFTIFFVIGVGTVTRINVYKMTRLMEIGESSKQTANRAALAAGGAFLAASLFLLFVLGWEVNGPFAGRRYNMIAIMHVCNFAASLAGGGVLGWLLAHESGGEPLADRNPEAGPQIASG